MSETAKPDLLLIATTNKGKFAEYTSLLAGIGSRTIGLGDLHDLYEPEETGRTFAENAAIKAESYAKRTGLWTLADDSGLEVAALNGRPGIHSARFGGTDTPFSQKIVLLLHEIERAGTKDRSARFVCSIALADPDGNTVLQAEGCVNGTITDGPGGTNGFGYDPVFMPDGYSITFGEMPDQEKELISHRAIATGKIVHEMQLLWAF